MADPLFVQDPKSQNRLEIKRYGYTMILDVSADGTECRCCYEPATTGGTPLTEAELQGHLAQFKIKEGFVPESLVSLLISAATSQEVNGILLARGIPMVPGEDGQIVLSVADGLAETKTESEEVPAGTLDFRQVQSFLNVDAGALIATIKPPGSGEPGRTVTGKIIPPQPGAPIKLEIGQNACLSDDGQRVFALAAGRVCCRGSAISVEDVYEIDGDVDFKVGNIVFKGFVEIKGDVLDGFSVKSTGGIKVHGIIGVCTIESDGNISFSGMNGRGKGTITCGGSISANYIYETSIECAGDVTVDVELRNSSIRTLGAILVNQRGISGGEYFALAGIESFFLGNVISLRTLVAAGIHYRDLEELNLLFNQLKQLVARFSDTSKEKLEPKEFAAQRSSITDKIQDVRQRTYAVCNPKINVSRMLYEGVTITLSNQSENIKETRKGPLSIIENTIEGGFRYLGMTPLSFKAQTIENTFIQQKQLEQNKIDK